MKNLCSGSQCGGFQFLLILDLWGISFHAVVVFALGKNLLFRFALGHCVQNRVWWHPKPPKTIEVNKKYTQICPDFVLQPWDDWHKKILLFKLENGQPTYLRTVKYVLEYTVIWLYYTQWNRMELLCWFFVGGEILLTHMIFLYHWTS